MTKQTVREMRLAAFASRTDAAKRFLEGNDTYNALLELGWLVRTLEDLQSHAPEQTFPVTRK
jgi:hypothetical protein